MVEMKTYVSGVVRVCFDDTFRIKAAAICKKPSFAFRYDSSAFETLGTERNLEIYYVVLGGFRL